MSNRIGTLTSTYPGKRFGSLCYFIKKKLQHRCFLVKFTKFLRTSFFTDEFLWLLLTLRLEKAKDNFDALITLTKEAIRNLQWWIKKSFYGVKKATVPRYYKSCLHGCIKAWVAHTVNEFQQEDHALTQKRLNIYTLFNKNQ